MPKPMLYGVLSFTLAALLENSFICYCQGFAPPAFVTIGAVFYDRPQADYETALRLAIDKINNDKSILPNTELKVVVNKSAMLDAFKNIEMGIAECSAYDQAPHRKIIVFQFRRRTFCKRMCM